MTILWDDLEAGDMIPMSEFHRTEYRADCVAMVTQMGMPLYCVRDNGHHGQHVTVDPSGYVMTTWATIN